MWECPERIDITDDAHTQAVMDFARTLARFHEAVFGYRSWITDRNAEF